MFPVRECPRKTGVKASPCKHGKYFDLAEFYN